MTGKNKIHVDYIKVMRKYNVKTEAANHNLCLENNTV